MAARGKTTRVRSCRNRVFGVRLAYTKRTPPVHRAYTGRTYAVQTGHRLPRVHQSARLRGEDMHMRLTMIRIALVLAILGLAACETVQGVGRDITAAGAAVDRAF